MTAKFTIFLNLQQKITIKTKTKRGIRRDGLRGVLLRAIKQIQQVFEALNHEDAVGANPRGKAFQRLRAILDEVLCVFLKERNEVVR